MTGIYIAIIILQVGVIVYFVRRNRNGSGSDKAPSNDSFEGRRKVAMEVTQEQLKLRIPDDKVMVFGVVMDWNTGDSIMSLAAYITGAANLYFNSGAGVHGAGKDPVVGEAAVRFVTAAGDYLASAMPAVSTELPAAGCVRFYLLTNKQTFAAQEQIKNIDSGNSSWLPLFSAGNEVITEMMN